MSYEVISESSFLSSQKSFKVTATSNTSNTKLYGENLNDYAEDVEHLLVKLTPEELEELNQEVDPDNSALPASERCKDQTKKSPTGPFKREQLLKYMEEKAKSERDWDEKVPYKKGLKRGKLWTAKDEQANRDPALDFFNVGDMPIELDIDDEYAEALTSAREQDLVDLAGILGLHNMLNQVQYYNALKGKPQETDHNSFLSVVKPSRPKFLPDEPPNMTNVESCIKRLNDDDESLCELNLNNIKTISKEVFKRLFTALKGNKHIKMFSMANTGVTDADIQDLVEVVESNKSLASLNVESNFLSGEFLAKLVEASLKNQTLVELHAENQRAAVLGHQVEMDIVKSVEQNENLLRLGLSFQTMEARHRISDALEKNLERIRLKRVNDE